tara:strand:- start:2164 stop:2523 length:360 start_codon:yes stop_codon:yes gene_type:complete
MIYNNSWIVSWTEENIDYNLLINDFRNRLHNGLILQEINENELDEYIYPDINDIVFISCKDKIILKCSILVINIIGKFEDKYRKKEEKELKNYYLLKIKKVYEDNLFMKTKKKIWVLYK